MVIDKGQLVEVYHDRWGRFVAVATERFDSDRDEWYALAVSQESPVLGALAEWHVGDPIPCRRELVRQISKIAGVR
jgi:hypothetical protein